MIDSIEAELKHSRGGVIVARIPSCLGVPNHCPYSALASFVASSLLQPIDTRGCRNPDDQSTLPEKIDTRPEEAAGTVAELWGRGATYEEYLPICRPHCLQRVNICGAHSKMPQKATVAQSRHRNVIDSQEVIYLDDTPVSSPATVAIKPVTVSIGKKEEITVDESFPRVDQPSYGQGGMDTVDTVDGGEEQENR